MSRNFEQAYKELAQIEVPDLWDRIEAGLSEKSTPVALKIDEAVKSEESVKETVRTENLKENSSKNKIFIFMKKYSAVAAALVCVAILIPAISLVGEFGIGGSKSEEALESAQEPAAMWEAAAEEAPAEMDIVAEEGTEETIAYAMEEAAEETTMGAAMEEAAEAEYESAPAEVADMAEKESMSNDAVAEMADMERAEAKKQEEKQDLSNAALPSLTERCPEGTVIRNVQIKVLEVSEMQKYFEGSSREEFGYICRAEVQRHPESLLTEGEQIDIFISGYLSIALVKSGVFELDLISFVEEEECYFEIEQYHKQLEP